MGEMEVSNWIGEGVSIKDWLYFRDNIIVVN